MLVRNTEQHFGLNYLVTGDDTGGNYFQCSTSIPPGDEGPPMHKHSNESEGFYVVSGSLKLISDGKMYNLKTGDFLIVPPDVLHTWCNDSNGTTELVITFSPSGIEDMFRELDKDGVDFEAVGRNYGMTINK